MSWKNASPEKQAASAAKGLSRLGEPRHGNKDDGKVHSRGTLRTYEQAFRNTARWMGDVHGSRLHHMSVEHARTYLESRATEVGQKTLNNERRALEMYFRHRDRNSTVSVPRVRSEIETVSRSRAYSDGQVKLVADEQSARLSLSTRIADAAGLRASELLSIRPLEERGPSTHRTWTADRFTGREDWTRYSVDGKGGLVREVRLPSALTAELETRRLDTPRVVVDRDIRIESHYDIAGGHRFTRDFTRDATRSLGWSEGAHGLRHGYAQRRMAELADHGVARDRALLVVSQEMGHFRPDVTEIYLR